MHVLSSGKNSGMQLHKQSLLIKTILGNFDACENKYSQIRTKDPEEQVKVWKFSNNADDRNFADIRVNYDITFFAKSFFDIILVILVKETVCYNRLYKLKQH